MIDLVGRKFGRLTVVSEAERTRSKGGTSIRMWNKPHTNRIDFKNKGSEE